MHKYVPGMGPIGAKLMILGEGPSYQETADGQPFKGPSGNELNKLLKDAGINRNECWITNVCKYEVPSNQKGQKIPYGIRAANVGIDIQEQLKELQEEINGIRPNCILALGGTALWALSGRNKISNFRGSIMHGMGRKFVSTYHPAHLLHSEQGEFKGYWNRALMVHDFKRAKKQSLFPELQLPQRSLQICQSSYQLEQFLNQYKNYKKSAVDIEAGGHCLPICIGLAFSKSHGMTVPLWNTDGISHMPDSDLTRCWILVADKLMEIDVIGQNFNYDRDKIKRLGFIIKHLKSDVMMKAFAINPELPKNLALQTSLYTEEPFYKDEGMYEGKIEDLLIGCARDACVTFEIDENMDSDLDELQQRPFFENFLMKLPDFYYEIEQTGFRINPETRDFLIHKYIEWDEKLKYQLFKLCGEEVNVNAHAKLKTLLFDKLGMPTRAGTGEEELTELLNLQSFTNEDHRKIVELVLEDRRVKKTINTYLMALPDYDERMKTTCFPCLDTGRSANGQQEPPIRPKVDLVGNGKQKDMKVMGMAFQTITKHGDIGQDIRSQFIPDEGCIFLQVDSSQAEARVCSLLANDEVMLARYDTHDIHALTASWFFGGSEDKYSKKVLGFECPERFIGKTLRHAGERGAKKRRAASEVNTQARKYKVPIKIDESQAEAALKVFHKMCPSIEKVYFKEVVEALEKNKRRLVGPIPYGIDAPFGGQRIFYERWGDELFRQAFSYLPQRSVTDNTKAAGIRIKGILGKLVRLVLESHDSLLYNVPIKDLEDIIPVVRQEMERPLDFSRCSLPRHSLIIPCEIEVGTNYQHIKKFKTLAELPLLKELSA